LSQSTDGLATTMVWHCTEASSTGSMISMRPC
jgi:hypothetical protein